ncbi:MAG TPA: serine hydrolase domain-containing protein [Vicinamibacterales bacterium]|nr:serine hydrolase domain-containing protein [Vicinamibacterales bacterium]
MSSAFAAARRVLQQALDDGVFPGAAAEVGGVEDRSWGAALGRLADDPGSPAVARDTIYDLASLTKVVATTTLAMRLVQRGALSLDTPVAAWLPGWRGRDREAVTVRHLLAHSSGLPAHLPLYETCAGRDAFEQAICRLPLQYLPGSASVYSDLGFILLGFIQQDAAGMPLDLQWELLSGGDALGRLGPGEELDDLRFGVRRDALNRTAPTRRDEWRRRLLVGEVDDNNAFALGGVAGHAGLFGTVAGIGAFARGMLRSLEGDETGVPVGRETLAGFLRGVDTPGSSRALGWDTMQPASSCGTRMSARAFGHTGFTGTSLWIDPDARRYAVLLSNRVHPVAGDPAQILAVRRAFHDAIWAR